jgi:hypothetical protein
MSKLINIKISEADLLRLFKENPKLHQKKNILFFKEDNLLDNIKNVVGKGVKKR